MRRLTPKYFHYFLAALSFDLLALALLLLPFLSVRHFFTVSIIWIISNFLNYPRLISRRYISYYKLLGTTVEQFLTFTFIYLVFSYLAWFSLENLLLKSLVPSLGLFAFRIVFVYLLRLYRKRGKGFNRVVVIGKTPLMTNLVGRFNEDSAHGYQIELWTEKVNYEEIESLITTRQINEIYCSSREVNQDDLAKLLPFSLNYGVSVLVISDNNDPNNLGILPLEISDISLDNYPLMDRKNLAVKRGFDILFSIIVIVGILSWIIPIFGILIKISSPGPVFFVQPRAGRNGEYFNCFKFRSMRKDANLKQAVKDDPRVTKIGKFMRKTSIDELPQFINVLMGKMSVVGPRPHPKNLNDRFDDQIDNYTKRILVKPGISGLSQISGFRGETKEKRSMRNRILTDIKYIRSWTFSLDLYIIYRTIVDVFMQKDDGAY